MADEEAVSTHPADEPARDTYTDLTARLAAADLGWAHEHGDPRAEPAYIQRLAYQVMAFQPPLIAGVYVDDATLDDMRDRLHGDNCGCGEWDSHSGEYVDRMDATIHAVLWPLRAAAPVPQGTSTEPLWSTYHPAAGDEAATVRHPGTLTECDDPDCRAVVEQGTEDTDYRTADDLTDDLVDWWHAYGTLNPWRVTGATLPLNLRKAAQRLFDHITAAVRDAEVARLHWLLAEAAWQRDTLSWLHAVATQRLYWALPELSYWRDIAAPALSDMLRGMARRSTAWHRQVMAGAREELRLAELLRQCRIELVKADDDLVRAVPLPDDWRQQISDCSSSGVAVDLIQEWRGGTGEEER